MDYNKSEFEQLTPSEQATVFIYLDLASIAINAGHMDAYKKWIAAASLYAPLTVKMNKFWMQSMVGHIK